MDILLSKAPTVINPKGISQGPGLQNYVGFNFIRKLDNLDFEESMIILLMQMHDPTLTVGRYSHKSYLRVFVGVWRIGRYINNFLAVESDV